MKTKRSRLFLIGFLLMTLFGALNAYAVGGSCWYDPSDGLHKCSCHDEEECAFLKVGCDVKHYYWYCYQSGLNGGCSEGLCVEEQDVCYNGGWDYYGTWSYRSTCDLNWCGVPGPAYLCD